MSRRSSVISYQSSAVAQGSLSSPAVFGTLRFLGTVYHPNQGLSSPVGWPEKSSGTKLPQGRRAGPALQEWIGHNAHPQIGYDI